MPCNPAVNILTLILLHWQNWPRCWYFWVSVVIKWWLNVHKNTIKTMVLVYSYNLMIIGVQTGIENWLKARKQPVMSQSGVSQESVTSDFWGCYNGTHWSWRGHFSQPNLRVSLRWVNFTCLNTFWGQMRDLKIGKFCAEPPKFPPHQSVLLSVGK